MKWIVKPTENINGLEFGTSREDVRAELGNPKKEFKKSKFSKNTTDDYGDFHVFYDGNNLLEAIEIFEGKVLVGETVIFPCSINEIIQIDNSFIKEEDGCISTKLSIGAYAPNGEVESILVGCANYY